MDVIYKEYKTIIKQNTSFFKRNDWVLPMFGIIAGISFVLTLAYILGLEGMMLGISIVLMLGYMSLDSWGSGLVNDKVLSAIANSPIIPSQSKNEIMEEIQKTHYAGIQYKTLEKILCRANDRYNHNYSVANNAFMKAMRK